MVRVIRRLKQRVRKYTRPVSAKRIERIPTNWKGYTRHTEFTFPQIFRGADYIYRLSRPRDSRMIFLGTGMRPLYETIRGINAYRQQFTQRDFRYLTTFPRTEFPSESGKSANNERMINETMKVLQEKGIITRGKKTYYLIDFKGSGRTLQFLSKAIQRMVEGARVIQLTQVVQVNESSDPIKQGIYAAEGLERPYFKKRYPEHLQPENREAFLRESRRSYLQFQQALHEWLIKNGPSK
jgi:hypothetical protein